LQKIPELVFPLCFTQRHTDFGQFATSGQARKIGSAPRRHLDFQGFSDDSLPSLQGLPQIGPYKFENEQLDARYPENPK